MMFQIEAVNGYRRHLPKHYKEKLESQGIQVHDTSAEGINTAGETFEKPFSYVEISSLDELLKIVNCNDSDIGKGVVVAPLDVPIALGPAYRITIYDDWME